MTRILILATVILGAGRLLVAVAGAPRPVERVDALDLPDPDPARPYRGCFGTVWPRVGGIRYIPDPSTRLIASFNR